MKTAIEQFEQTATKVISRFLDELKSMRSSKATSQMLDSVMVEAYGTMMSINELATVQASDATLLLVTTWDKSLIPAVEKAIAGANLNLNPVVDGALIRIAVPPLTEEKRKDLVKKLHAKAEEIKVMIRTARMDAKRDIEALQNTAGVSEDDVKRELEVLEKKIQKFLVEISEIVDKKEEQLLKL